MVKSDNEENKSVALYWDFDHAIGIAREPDAVRSSWIGVTARTQTAPWFFWPGTSPYPRS